MSLQTSATEMSRMVQLQQSCYLPNRLAPFQLFADSIRSEFPPFRVRSQFNGIIVHQPQTDTAVELMLPCKQGLHPAWAKNTDRCDMRIALKEQPTIVI